MIEMGVRFYELNLNRSEKLTAARSEKFWKGAHYKSYKKSLVYFSLLGNICSFLLKGKVKGGHGTKPLLNMLVI